MANVSLALGELQPAAGRSAEAQPSFARAEAELRRLEAAGNESPDIRAAMVAAHAFQGRREEVGREAPALIAAQAKDPWTGRLAEEDAARAFCLVEDHERGCRSWSVSYRSRMPTA